MERTRSYLLPAVLVAVILAGGIVAGSYFIGNILYKAKVATV